MRGKQYKLLFALIASMIMVWYMMPVVAYADVMKGDQIVSGQGLFTPTRATKIAACEKLQGDINKMKDNYNSVIYKQAKIDEGEAKKFNKNDESKSDKAGAKAIANGFFGEGTIKEDEGKKDKFSGLIKPVVGDGLNTMTDKMLDVNCKNNFSFLTMISNIDKPLNLTHNPVVMEIIGITQAIALGVSVILVVVYGLMTTFGFQKTDPFKFGMRLAFAMGAVYFLPYLIQDILNLNNVIVDALSTIDIKSSSIGNAVEAGSLPVLLVILSAVGAFLGSLATAAGAAALFSGGILGLVIMAVVLVFVVLIIKPILKIVLWWYMRMLYIFLLAILGPFFVILVALPQTSNMAEKWLKSLISETFSQTFMVAGLFLFANIWKNIGMFSDAANISFIGELLLLYAMILFLGKIPEIAQGFIGGARNPGQQIGDSIANGLTNGIINAASASRNMMKEAQKNSAARKEQGTQQATLAKSSFGQGGVGKQSEVTQNAANMMKQGGQGGAGGEQRKTIDDLIKDKEAKNKNGSNVDGNKQIVDKDGKPISTDSEKSGGKGAEGEATEANPIQKDETGLDNVDKQTLNDIATGLSQGNMDRNRAKNALTKSMMDNDPKLSRQQAERAAEKVLQQEEERTGMKWDQKNDFNKALANGDMTPNDVRGQLEQQALKSGMNKEEAGKHANQVMKANNYDKVDAEIGGVNHLRGNGKANGGKGGSKGGNNAKEMNLSFGGHSVRAQGGEGKSEKQKDDYKEFDNRPLDRNERPNKDEGNKYIDLDTDSYYGNGNKGGDNSDSGKFNPPNPSGNGGGGNQNDPSSGNKWTDSNFDTSQGSRNNNEFELEDFTKPTERGTEFGSSDRGKDVETADYQLDLQSKFDSSNDGDQTFDSNKWSNGESNDSYDTYESNTLDKFQSNESHAQDSNDSGKWSDLESDGSYEKQDSNTFDRYQGAEVDVRESSDSSKWSSLDSGDSHDTYESSTYDRFQSNESQAQGSSDSSKWSDLESDSSRDTYESNTFDRFQGNDDHAGQSSNDSSKWSSLDSDDSYDKYESSVNDRFQSNESNTGGSRSSDDSYNKYDSNRSDRFENIESTTQESSDNTKWSNIDQNDSSGRYESSTNERTSNNETERNTKWNNIEVESNTKYDMDQSEKYESEVNDKYSYTYNPDEKNNKKFYQGEQKSDDYYRKAEKEIESYQEKAEKTEKKERGKKTDDKDWWK